MKQRFTKLLAAVALLVFMMPSLAGWGQTRTETTSTYVWTSKAWGDATSSWISDKDGYQKSTSPDAVQVTASYTGAGAHSNSSFSNITKISVNAATTSKGVGSITVKVGEGDAQTICSLSKNSTFDDYELTFDPAVSGVVTFVVNCSTNSMYMHSISVTTADGGSATPTCTVDPESWDFGSMQVGSSAQSKTFTVTTANLTHGMSVSLSDYEYYSITNNVYGFSSSATTTDIVVEFNPSAVGTHTATLILAGDDFEDDIEVPLTATVVSNDPTCTINPTTWEFGNVALGMSATKEFTVTTANLTGNLTLAMSESVYSVTPATIAQNATTTTVTVTFAPTEAGEVDDVLSITGGGLTNATTAIVSGVGYQAQTYTITFDAGSGTCTTETMTGVSGSEITLPTATPSQACQDAGWTFAGWATTSVDETTTAPTLLLGSYTITSDATLYAVYQLAATQVTTFNIATIAANNNWTSGTQYSSINIDPVTLTATGGANDGKYYSSDQTWRFYSSSSGKLTVTSSNNNVIAVSSSPSKTFTINNGTATYTATSNTSFKEIVVTTVSNITYKSNPACQEKVATPVITLDEGTYTSVQTTTITCATEDATIFYTTDGSTPTAESTEYTGAITIDQSMTIKAIAVKEGMDDSDEASATYTINLPLSTIDEIFAQATVNGSSAKNVNVTFGGWVVSGVSGNNVYVTDNEGKGFIIYKNNHGFAVNDKLSGTVLGTPLKLYNGSAEFTNLTASTSGLSVTQDGEITVLTNATIDNLGGVNTGAVITLSNLTFDGTYLTDGTNEIKPYTTLYDYETSFVSGPSYNVTGVYLQYNTNNSETKEILPRSAADIEQISTLDIIGYGTDHAVKNGWYLIASPVANDVTPSADNGFITDYYDLYCFNQTAELEWENHEVHSFDIESGRGYLYASSTNTTLVFAGTPYSGDGVVQLNHSDGADYDGINLVGNPFATTATISLPYYKMNDNRTALTAKIENGTIAAMEGVFVYAYNETTHESIPSVTFTASRSRGNSNASVNIDVMHNGAAIDNAIVRFDEGRQLPKYQLFKNSTKLYITKNGKDYAIVNSEAQGEMPVNFKAQENGTYTLSINTENVEMNYLHLIDNMTGMDVDLLQTPSYTFDATTNDYTSRFRLVFSANNVDGPSTGSGTFAFYSNGNWVIGNEGEATLQVIDVNGRIVSNETINGSVNKTITATPGVYMLRLVNGNEVKTQKIVVR